MSTGYHAEHVGSLLRPPWLLEARAANKRGDLSDADLHEAEDRAASEVIELQRAAGLQVFTDGEVRRTNWMDGLLSSIGGLVPVERVGVEWFRPDGSPPTEETDFDQFAANARVFQRAQHTGTEAAFLARHAPGQFKITMISASMGGLLWNPELTAPVYPTPDDLVGDLVALQIAEIERLIDSGVTWVQLDSLGYNRAMDPHFLSETMPGPTPENVLAATVEADARIVRAAKQDNPDVIVGMHICRGNNRSAWMAEGGYEPVAERLFGEVGVDRFLLEYDSERAGGFEPLRFIQPGTTVVLGLVSSKVPELESPDDLRRRVDQAAAYVPLDNLALSPQCGFASTSPGNLLTIDQERRKLALVADTAEKIWG
jgi:5-methyltetrahydropteroyltriglutamate--homocysteine methyltransferase